MPMEASRVQWLQKMGIDVWRPRTIERVPQDLTLSESAEDSTGSESRPISASKKSVAPQVSATKKTSLRTKRSEIQDQNENQKSKPVEYFKTEVFCSYGVGLLLVKDSQALDRDIAEDIFRSYRLLKDDSTEQSEISFFRFFWPQATRLRYDKGEVDESLDGARLAFLSTIRSSITEPPDLVLAIGPSAVQLSDCGISKNARVLHFLDEPDSSKFKSTLWKLLRDEQ